jgi:hypothetical protein
MPIKVLFIEDDEDQQNQIKSILNKNVGIQYHTIHDFNEICTELNDPDYTHIISCYSIKNKCIIDYIEFLTIPALVISENKDHFSNFPLNIINPPLSYNKLFSFLSETPIISTNTLLKYDNGDKVFKGKIKDLIKKEFKENLVEIPELIKVNNLREIKNRTHKIISKFALLEMNKAVDLSKEIDINIIDNPKKQIFNMRNLLVDIEIALKQLN